MRKAPLKQLYKKRVLDALSKKYSYKNPMLLPSLKKIVVSMGLGRASQDKQKIQSALKDLELITEQKPLCTLAKVSISNFKLRKGQVNGAMVTLRGNSMYEFLYKFTNISVPRIPDFRGFKKKGDGTGNYSLGIKEQTIFPEIDLDKMQFSQGMNIAFVTTARSDEESIDFLRAMGVPFKR